MVELSIGVVVTTEIDLLNVWKLGPVTFAFEIPHWFKFQYLWHTCNIRYYVLLMYISTNWIYNDKIGSQVKRYPWQSLGQVTLLNSTTSKNILTVRSKNHLLPYHSYKFLLVTCNHRIHPFPASISLQNPL